jgi:hypothetical protein
MKILKNEIADNFINLSNMLYIYHCGDFFEIISLTLYEALQANEIPCQLCRNVDEHLDDVWILFCSFFDLITLPQKYIVYQTEPMISSYGQNSPYMKFLRGAKQIWEYSKLNYDYLKKHPLCVDQDIIYLPFRYAHCMETWNQPDCEGDESIDVLLVGAPTTHRKIILEKLRDQGFVVMLNHGLFGKAREQLIRNAKINLILHKTADCSSYPQDISRIFPIGAKRCFMISETLKDCPVSSLIQSQTSDLVETIRSALSDREFRQQNIEAVYHEVTSMTMANEMAQVVISSLEKLQNK